MAEKHDDIMEAAVEEEAVANMQARLATVASPRAPPRGTSSVRGTAPRAPAPDEPDASDADVEVSRKPSLHGEPLPLSLTLTPYSRLSGSDSPRLAAKATRRQQERRNPNPKPHAKTR